MAPVAGWWRRKSRAKRVMLIVAVCVVLAAAVVPISFQVDPATTITITDPSGGPFAGLRAALGDKTPLLSGDASIDDEKLTTSDAAGTVVYSRRLVRRTALGALKDVLSSLLPHQGGPSQLVDVSVEVPDGWALATVQPDARDPDPFWGGLLFSDGAQLAEVKSGYLTVQDGHPGRLFTIRRSGTLFRGAGHYHVVLERTAAASTAPATRP